MTTFLQIGPYGGCVDEKSPFPDGQPHIKLSDDVISKLDFERIQISARIASPVDMLNIGEMVDIIRHHNIDAKIDLVLYYVWGRMDRRLSDAEPYTLRVVCDFINSLKFRSVKVFCPHSQATSDLLDNYVPFGQEDEDRFFSDGIQSTLRVVDYHMPPLNYRARNARLSLVVPDVGAMKRFTKSNLLDWYPNTEFVVMHKDRDERTGKILGMRIIQGVVRAHCVFIDDLCDGGATFTHGQKPLREAGAKTVSLIVPHGIFSKGTTIEGIDYIYTSNSFKDWEPHETLGVHKLC